MYDKDFSQVNILPGAYIIETLNNEIKRKIIEFGYFTESNYLFTIKPNFSTLGSIIERSSKITGSQTAFTPDGSIGDLLGNKPNVLKGEYNLSDQPDGIFSFHNSFFECDIGQGMIFKGKRSGIIHNFTMDFDPGYMYIEKFRGGVTWYMMESKDLVSNISFKLKKN